MRAPNLPLRVLLTAASLISAFGLAACELPQGPTQLDLRTAALALTGQATASDTEAAQALSKLPADLDWQARSTARSSWELLKKDPSVYVWTIEDQRIRIPHYCRDECACVAQRLGPPMHQTAPEAHVFQLWVRGGGKLGGVAAFVGPQRLPIFWDYHVALVVRTERGLSFIDPIVFGDAEARSFAEWHSRFEHATPMRFVVHPVSSQAANK